jgi:hypothetical protein
VLEVGIDHAQYPGIGLLPSPLLSSTTTIFIFDPRGIERGSNAAEKRENVSRLSQRRNRERQLLVAFFPQSIPAGGSGRLTSS